MAYRKPLRAPFCVLVLVRLCRARAPAVTTRSPSRSSTAADDAPAGDGPVIDSSSSDDAGSDALALRTAPRTIRAPTPTPARRTRRRPRRSRLTATTTSLTSITLAWTAVGDDGTTGTATGYEIRQSAHADHQPDGVRGGHGRREPRLLRRSQGPRRRSSSPGLTAGTAYHYAMRAHDEVPNQGEISADATATTLVRAALLISEVAVSNVAAQGFDFVELVAITAGRVDGLVVREASASLYTFGALTVAAGRSHRGPRGGHALPDGMQFRRT